MTRLPDPDITPDDLAPLLAELWAALFIVSLLLAASGALD